MPPQSCSKLLGAKFYIAATLVGALLILRYISSPQFYAIEIFEGSSSSSLLIDNDEPTHGKNQIIRNNEATRNDAIVEDQIGAAQKATQQFENTQQLLEKTVLSLEAEVKRREMQEIRVKALEEELTAMKQEMENLHKKQVEQQQQQKQKSVHNTKEEIRNKIANNRAQEREEEWKATTENISKQQQEKNESNDDEKDEIKEEERLNILVLYGDDWTLKTLGALNSFVKTPNLDALASRGMLFTHNCVTTSICMVSRATLYTGQYASRHKNYLPKDDVMFADGIWNETVFPLLRNNGYHTGMVGKWHHPHPPVGTFDLFRNYFGNHYHSRNGVTKHVTKYNEEDAIEFLQNRPRDKNFALLVSFFAIHAEDHSQERYRPQNKSMPLYAHDTVPTPKTATEKHFQDLPYFFHNGANYGRGRWKGRYSTPQLYQKMMKNMYRMVTEVDETCGKILEEIKKQGVMDKTLVIFTTDNGNLHGEHGLAEKWFPFEESIRVPLIIQDPRMPDFNVGGHNDDFTLNIDLAPTILTAAKIAVPKVMQGRDISQLYRMNPGDRDSWRDEFYYEWFTGDKQFLPASLAVVRKDSKYILWPEYDYEQLFRLDNDPFEEKDLYQSNLKTDKNLLEAMKARMAELKTLAAAGTPM